MALLEVNDIHAYYGNIHALKGLSIYVDEGEIVSLIGGNGAGKTTTLRAICGLMPLREGRISLKGEDLSAYKAHELVSKGIAMVPEGRGVFSKLTVLDNLEIERDLRQVYELFPRLEERKTQVAGTLSGGEQQMLATGRALMSRPSLLLMDEPSMGLAPVLVEAIFSTIEDINKNGTTVLLVEQNAHMALQIANRGYVLQTGEIVLQETAEALRKNEMVQKVYLGID
ncbi:MAG: ABC transporter ATP-binding protein [Chloroflexota bacterium]